MREGGQRNREKWGCDKMQQIKQPQINRQRWTPGSKPRVMKDTPHKIFKTPSIPIFFKISTEYSMPLWYKSQIFVRMNRLIVDG